MWWSEPRRLSRLLAVLALAGLTGGCFQPLYGEHSFADRNGALVGKMASVEVGPINTAKGTSLDRVGVNIRNALIFEMTGGGGGGYPTHRLDIKLTSTQMQVIVDINSARPEIQNYGIDATYTLVDLATNKPVIRGQTFARVSYNIPGQMQRFSGARGQRDAENRAAQVIADNVHARLASFFVAGS